MKVTIAPSDLADALAVAGESVGGARALPTLGCVLVEASRDGGVTLTGTDERIRSWKTVPAVVEADGAACLPPSELNRFLAAAQAGGAMSLTVGANLKAALVCGPTSVRVSALDAEGFPSHGGAGDVAGEVWIYAGAFKALVASVAFAADPKPDGSVFKECVHVACDGRALRFEATDGHRFARRTLSLDDAPTFEALVPASSLAKAAKLIGTKGDVRLAATPSHLVLDAGDVHVALRCATGTFPDADRIMPKVAASRVLADRATLERALRLVDGLDKLENGYRVDLSIEDGRMGLRAGRAEDHEARTEIPIDLEGDAVSLAMTATHLAQAVDALDAHERVRIAIQSPNHPVLVTGVGDEAGEQVHVLMPLVAVKR